MSRVAATASPGFAVSDGAETGPARDLVPVTASWAAETLGEPRAGSTRYSLDSRSAISGTTASSAYWIDSTEFVE